MKGVYLTARDGDGLFRTSQLLVVLSYAQLKHLSCLAPLTKGPCLQENDAPAEKEAQVEEDAPKAKAPPAVEAEVAEANGNAIPTGAPEAAQKE